MAASEPTFPLFMTLDNLQPFTLSQNFGTLTQVWDVPLSDKRLTPMSATRLLRFTEVRSWTGGRPLSEPVTPIRSSTFSDISSGAVLGRRFEENPLSPG
jgi:hypothetical protein